MTSLKFELSQPEHAKSIAKMRLDSSVDLLQRLGPGHWGGPSSIQTVRERITNGDPEVLRRKTLYVANLDGEAVGSIAVSTFPPGFWKRSYWQESRAIGLGVFDLVVSPDFQRQGIGRFLMTEVEKLANKHQIAFVRLDAYTDNPISNAFYQRSGYEIRAKIDLRGVGLTLYEKQVMR